MPQTEEGRPHLEEERARVPIHGEAVVLGDLLALGVDGDADQQFAVLALDKLHPGKIARCALLRKKY